MNAYLATLRLTIAQFPRFYYLLAPLVYVVLLLAFYSGLAGDGPSQGNGATDLGYQYFTYGIVMAMLAFALLIPCLIISWNWLGAVYQHDDRSETFYSLPLSSHARVALVATVVLVIIPLLVTVPVLLLHWLVSVVHPLGILVGNPLAQFPQLLTGLVVYYASMVVWLFPRLGVRHHSATVTVVAFLLIVATIVYSGDQRSGGNFYLPAPVLAQPDVVGLSESVRIRDRESSVRITQEDDLPIWVGAPLLLLAVSATYFAIYKKQV